MWGMAGKAGKSAAALAETGTLGEIERLMTGVPGIGPISIVTGGGGLSVAGATRLVHLGGSHVFRISHGAPAGNVVLAWPVADFALHAGLEGSDSCPRAKAQGSGGVALEAAEDGDIRIERAVLLASRGAVAWGQSHGMRGGIPTQPVFEIGIFVNAADERDRLQTRAERPFPRLRRH